MCDQLQGAARALRKLNSVIEISNAEADLAHEFTTELLALQPADSSDSYLFKWEYLRKEILSKYCDPSPEGAKDRVAAAVDKLLASERRCKQFNKKGFAFFRSERVMHQAQFYIGQCLGDIRECLESYDTMYHFPHGATTCFRRRSGDPYFRFHEGKTSDVTASAFRYATYLRQSTPRWAGTKFNIVSGNAVFTVPKANDIDRCACKEPGLNQALQKGVGSFIRKRLKSFFSIDLNDQSVNCNLARYGSFTNRLATLDLSSASDSISCRIVDELLPNEWSHFLNEIRSPYGTLPDGTLIAWEKHSTMGNGYTFELESLIFYCLVRAAIDIDSIDRFGRLPSRRILRRVGIYGDDIICPSLFATNVVTVLEGCGFTINEKKSFSNGLFRESCGGHFHKGNNVKPFYIRKPIDSVSRVIWLLNSLREWAADDDGWCDPSVYDLWLKWKRKFVPPHFLGGRNTESNSELVSPEEPRASVSPRSKSRKIVGYPAVLRWFQLSMTDRPTYGHGRDQSLDSVTVPGWHGWSVQTYVPSLEKYSVFPQETVKLGVTPRSGYRDY